MLQRFSRRLASQRGASTVEVLMAVAVLAIASQATVLAIRTASRQVVSDRDRLFAAEKALQMLDELRSVVMDESQPVTVLDDTTKPGHYNDGSIGNNGGQPVLRYTLTTKPDITAPNGIPASDNLSAVNPLSANPPRKDGLAFVRNVDIRSVNSTYGTTREIWVRVWAAAPNGGTSAFTTPTAKDLSHPLAQVYGKVHSLGTSNPPTQTLDIYLIQLESVPGWWVRTSNLLPLMQTALASMVSRNPGLQVRVHKIQTMSFGRDMEYTPEYNQTLSSEQSGAFKKAYIYPGLTQYDDAADQYYPVNNFLGRMNVDGSLTNDNSDQTGPNTMFQGTRGYAIADQFNHAVQEPEEERIYGYLQQLAKANGMADPEPSWRMLLDRMNDPTNAHYSSMLNSIIINLHGEMVPVPPLRNYADAAKDPDYFWNTVRHDAGGNTLPSRAWRAVSHAERLAYNEAGGPSNATVRVYAYDMNPPADPISAQDEADVIPVVTLFIPGNNLGALRKVWRLQGNSQTMYKWITQTASNWNTNSSAPALPSGVYSDGTNLSNGTWYADNYSPPGRTTAGSGLRIRLMGVTPTARLYYGAPY